jgi:hypothetical protein
MRRLGPVLLALAVVVGCGGDDDGATSTTARAGAAPTTSVTQAATGAGTTERGAAAGTGGSPRSGGVPDGGRPSDTTVAGSAALAPGGVGGLASALLRPGNGNRIVVEVRAQGGAAPRSGTLDHLVGVLRQVSGKAVSVDGVDALGGAAQPWTSQSIALAADRAAQHAQGGTQVVLRLLFLHGTYEGDDSVLGVAVRGDVAAVFTDQVASAAGLLTSAAVVEEAVTTHEVGHLLGLVDLVIDTGRDDPDHPGHSSNQRSVMYWAVESDLVGQVLGGGVPTDLDAQDRADLARIRAG